MKSSSVTKPSSLLLTVIPDWPEYKWSTFYAEHFDAIWSDGRIGLRRYEHKPTPQERADLLTRIVAARAKIARYDDELDRAEKLLSLPS